MSVLEMIYAKHLEQSWQVLSAHLKQIFTRCNVQEVHCSFCSNILWVYWEGHPIQTRIQPSLLSAYPVHCMAKGADVY